MYANATSSSAKHFLLELVEQVPYAIESIQVDGSSEFMADSLGALRNELRKAINKHNTYRSHHVLKEQTPMEYISNLSNQKVST